MLDHWGRHSFFFSSSVFYGQVLWAGQTVYSNIAFICVFTEARRHGASVGFFFVVSIRVCGCRCGRSDKVASIVIRSVHLVDKLSKLGKYRAWTQAVHGEEHRSTKPASLQ